MMRKILCKNYEELSRAAALVMARQIWEKPDSVLGLATGGTPVGLYRNLVAMYQGGDLDFSRAISFNLDEYYPIEAKNLQSFAYFMQDNLFSHVNFLQTHIPDGEATDPEAECARYEAAIRAAGGIDLQLLGSGNNGHIGFNEPAPQLPLDTHVTGLTEDTVQANARFFASADEVPRRALTMGIGAIMASRKILLLLSGKAKAPVTARLFGGKVSTDCPLTLLNLHPDVTVIVDEDAAG